MVSSEIDMAPCVPGLEAATDSECVRNQIRGHVLQGAMFQFPVTCIWESFLGVPLWQTLACAHFGIYRFVCKSEV